MATLSVDSSTLHLILVNKDPNEAAQVSLSVNGFEVQSDASVTTVTASIHTSTSAIVTESSLVLPKGQSPFTVNFELPAFSVSAIDITADTSVQNPGHLQFSSSEYSVNEGDGSVTITVGRVGGSDGEASVDYTTISGSATAGSDYGDSSDTLNWNDGVSGDRSFTVSIIDDGLEEQTESFSVSLSNAVGASLSSPSTTTVTIDDDDAAIVELPLRINSAGQDYTDSDGNLWHADQPYSVGSWGYVDGYTVNRWDTDSGLDIVGTTKDYLYVTERFWVSAYQFDLPDGNYDVVLHFAETFSDITGPEQRIFDVFVEEQIVLDNFDPYAEAGFAHAVTKTITNIAVADGRLDITFTPDVQAPEINAIEVLAALGQDILGDTDSDGDVDFDDLVRVAVNYGKTTDFDTRIDVNNDGRINLFDLFIVAIHFGTTT
jgi:hypothetical protein